MSKIIASAAIRGAHSFVKDADDLFNKARESKGEDTPLAFPDTAYYLPMSHALMGAEVKTVGELKPILDHAKELLGQEPESDLWFPYLGNALDAGIATLLSQEAIMAMRYLNEEQPEADCNANPHSKS